MMWEEENGYRTLRLAHGAISFLNRLQKCAIFHIYFGLSISEFQTIFQTCTRIAENPGNICTQSFA